LKKSSRLELTRSLVEVWRRELRYLEVMRFYLEEELQAGVDEVPGEEGSYVTWK
jgi:hypothetical protein